MTDRSIAAEVARYYEAKLLKFGPTARGVDWNGFESQELRFEQLTKVLDGVAADEEFSLLDVGCGYGALVAFLGKRFSRFQYDGYDISEEMLRAAKSLHGTEDARVRFIGNWDAGPTADFSVASGIFNVRLDCEADEWREHVLSTLRRIDAKSRRGWSANFLTVYSDEERMKDYLYYADPAFLFDWCKRNASRRVALLHDYELYEFTLIVRKAEPR